MLAFSSEKKFADRHSSDLQKSAENIAEAVWILYIDASASYLDQIFVDRSYKYLSIRDIGENNLFVQEAPPLKGTDALLSKIGLIRTFKLQREIFYYGKAIGSIEAVAYNKLIYMHLNTLSIAVLTMLIVWFALKLVDSKNILEDRVSERTKELKENKERLSFALFAGKSGIWDWDIVRSEVYFDDNYYKIAGYEPRAFPFDYMEWHKRVHPEDITQVEEKVSRCIKEGINEFSAEFRFKRADDSWMWILAQGKVSHRDKDNNPVRFLGTHTDITTSKEIAEELIQSEQRYFSLFNNSHTIMFLVNPKTSDLIDANPAAVNYYGYSRSELLAKKAYEINTLGKDEVEESIARAAEAKSEVMEMQHTLKSGEVRDVAIYSGPIKYKGENLVFSIIHDISKRREAERELHNLNNNLKMRVDQEVSKSRRQEEIIHNQKKLADMGNMISAISHQWRQPLNALGFYVQDVSDAHRLGEMDKNYLDKFENESMDIIGHLSSTIDDFRYFFQPDKKAENMKVIREIYSLLRLTLAQLQNNHIKIYLKCRCDNGDFVSENLNKEPSCIDDYAQVLGYKGEFKQVLANLIYNSIDAIRDQGIESGFITVEVLDDGEDVTIEICDNGGGIPDEVSDKIFNPYFSTKPEGKGTGIGLYMSKAIIEDHMNGIISFENRDEGACFLIRMPKVW